MALIFFVGATGRGGSSIKKISTELCEKSIQFRSINFLNLSITIIEIFSCDFLTFLYWFHSFFVLVCGVATILGCYFSRASAGLLS